MMHCEKDENGHCKTHGPGRPGEVDTMNKVIDAVTNDVKFQMHPLVDIFAMLAVLASAVDQQNEKARAANPEAPQLTNVEAQARAILEELLNAGVKAVDALGALRQISPHAS